MPAPCEPLIGTPPPASAHVRPRPPTDAARPPTSARVRRPRLCAAAERAMTHATSPTTAQARRRRKTKKCQKRNSACRSISRSNQQQRQLCPSTPPNVTVPPKSSFKKQPFFCAGTIFLHCKRKSILYCSFVRSPGSGCQGASAEWGGIATRLEVRKRAPQGTV